MRRPSKKAQQRFAYYFGQALASQLEIEAQEARIWYCLLMCAAIVKGDFPH